MKMLMNTFFLLGLPMATLACTFNTYTDRSAWEAAVGSFTEQNFDSEPVTSSVVQSITFGRSICVSGRLIQGLKLAPLTHTFLCLPASGITAAVTEGASDEVEDFGVSTQTHGLLKIRLGPNNDYIGAISFSLPASSRALGLDVSGVNRDTAYTSTQVQVGSNTFELPQFLDDSGNGGLAGFFGIETSDSSCDFSSFDLAAIDKGLGGREDFQVSRIDFAAASTNNDEVTGSKDGAGKSTRQTEPFIEFITFISVSLRCFFNQVWATPISW